jgi:hypothetical protein
MCDYSLMSVPTRLAREGEELVAHRFPTGAKGLASPSDLHAAPPVEPMTFWSSLKKVFAPLESKPVPAVCIPPGARLLLRDIPKNLQCQLAVSEAEKVTFTQLTAAEHTYRDAVRFQNGRVIRLQELRQGQRVRVLDLSFIDAEVRDPAWDQQVDVPSLR